MFEIWIWPMLMLEASGLHAKPGAPSIDGSSPFGIYLYVEEVDAT